MSDRVRKTRETARSAFAIASEKTRIDRAMKPFFQVMCFFMGSIILSLGELVNIKADIFSPVFIQPVRVILSTNGTVAIPEEHDKLTLATSLDPTVIVFLNSSSAPASLRAIGGLHARVKDTVLLTLSSILSVANSSDNRSQHIPTLRANVHLDSILECLSSSLTVLLEDGILSGNLEHEQKREL